LDKLNRELAVLDLYLTTCQKKEFLPEGVWLAFSWKERNPSWDILKCFERAIWDWLLAEGKKGSSCDLKAIVKKVNSLNKKYRKDSTK